MKMNAKKVLSLLFTLFIVVGCMANKSSDTQVKLVNSSIINGQKGDKDLDEDLNLSIASIPQSNSSCSGILISSNVVLTAAHCIEADFKLTFIYLGDRAPFPRYRDEENENKYPVEKVIIHPSSGRNNDLALIILKEKAKQPFRPMKINSGFDFIQRGTPLHIAGFSWYSIPFKTDIFDRLNSEVTDMYVVKNYERDLSTQYLTKNVFIDEDIKPSDEEDVIYYSQISGGICSGDSGGPTIIKSADHLFLVGINKSASGIAKSKIKDCEFLAKSTSVFFHKTWITEAIAEAQAEQPEFVSSITLKDLDSNELQCGNRLLRTLNVYANLQDPAKETCSALDEDEASMMDYLTSLDEKCQKACQGIRGFEGQCDFYIKGAEKMHDAYKSKCEARLKK